MPILNYTTRIPVDKTAMEIASILAKAGAQRVQIEYANRVPHALTFTVQMGGNDISFRLPSRWEGVLQLLVKDASVPRSAKNEDQARRVAWRIIKDWTEAQVAIVEAGAAELPEVFLPYAVRPGTGRTLFEEFQYGGLLPAGEEREA